MTELTSLKKHQESKFGVKEYFTLDWYFHGWEKVVLVGLVVWSMYAIYKILITGCGC